MVREDFVPEPLALFGLHWLRPFWLLALGPLAVCWWRLRSRRRGDHWRNAVDASLRPYVLDRSLAGPGPGDHALFAGWLVAVLVLAGPVWERHVLPASDLARAEVLVVDLSASMRANDLSPSRHEQARFLVEDLLASAGDAVVGLIVFSERPYVVSPLTDDLDTLRHFVAALSPDIMPVQGSRPDLAIELASALLERTGMHAGHIVLLTDGVVTALDIEAAAEVRRAGHRLSVVAITRGAETVPLPRTREPAIPAVDREGLRVLARTGDGAYTAISPTTTVTDALAPVRRRLAMHERPGRAGGAERWIDHGGWAVLGLGLCAVGLFVRYRIA